MKNLSLILVSALAATQAAQAAPASFHGFYVGGQLGWTQRNDKTNLLALNAPDGTNITSALNKTKKITGLTYGLYAGYGQNNNGFYWGAECSLEQDTASKNVTNTLKLNPSIPNNVTGALNTKYERGVVFGLTPHPSYWGRDCQ